MVLWGESSKYRRTVISAGHETFFWTTLKTLGLIHTSFISVQIADVDFCINGTEFKFYVKPYFLGELETPISNWNLEMPFFEETRNQDTQRKSLSKQR